MKVCFVLSFSSSRRVAMGLGAPLIFSKIEKGDIDIES